MMAVKNDRGIKIIIPKWLEGIIWLERGYPVPYPVGVKINSNAKFDSLFGWEHSRLHIKYGRKGSDVFVKINRLTQADLDRVELCIEFKECYPEVFESEALERFLDKV